MKLIPPGGEGKITVTVSTKGFGGEEINKSVEIQTNDAANRKLNVTMTGKVQRYVEVTPERAILKGKVNEPITVAVSIKPRPECPVKVLNITTDKGQYFHYTLTGDGSSGYVLTIENTKKDVGYYNDNIYLKTDSTVCPLITIGVIGIVKESL